MAAITELENKNGATKINRFQTRVILCQFKLKFLLEV